MIIEYKNYLIVQEQSRFNLQRKITRTKKGADGNPSNETYEDVQDLGYGYTLENCISTLILRELEDNNSKVTLNTFINEYKTITKELLKEIKL